MYSNNFITMIHTDNSASIIAIHYLSWCNIQENTTNTRKIHKKLTHPVRDALANQNSSSGPSENKSF